MAKDPAFLFYSSDFLSGIQDLTMEERGQYITLLCLQHQKGHLTDKTIRLAVANAAADVMAKFRQDSAGLWYNVRLEEETEKRRAHTEKQRLRAVDGWKKRKSEAAEDTTANAAALPLENVIENRNENVIEVKGVQGEKFSDKWFSEIFDEILVESIRSTFPKHDLENEFKIFRLKVRGSPADYENRDTGGIRQAFIYQLKNSKPHEPRNSINGNQTNVRRADAIITQPKDYGTF